jgi:hypothetical protein
MKAELSLFVILILFLLSSVAFAESSNSIINLEVTVLPNIVSYFDGKDIIAKTNDSQPVVVTKEKIKIASESGYEYTITQSL